MARIYVMRGDGVIVLSRRRPAMPRLQPVPRSWNALAEIPHRTGHPPGETALIFAPPVALGLAVAALAPAGAAVAAGGAMLVASTYLTPSLRRRLAGRRLRRRENIVLRDERARSAFDRALAIADRVSETWPGLGPLVDADESARLLAEALWQIAAVLARREDLDAVLDADPIDLGSAGVELRSQLSSARAARARLAAELARREASLHRAEEAGRDFIREQQMRRAVLAAGQTLRTAPDAASWSGQSPSAPGTAPTGPDAGADLAEYTHSVLAAYHELTAGLAPD